MDTVKLEKQLADCMQSYGLAVVGWFSMFSGPAETQGRLSALIGNRGNDMWRVFRGSDFYNDGVPNPLDCWTKSIIDPVAEALEGKVCYPFLEESTSSDYWPFQQWAKAATGLQQSPPGLLIDPEFGLWQAFRAVLVFDRNDRLPPIVQPDHPCDDCAAKPCLTVCPVAAIAVSEFRVGACRDHVGSPAGISCLTGGCVARNACPIGRNHGYSAEQQAFHMEAYLPG